jgi:isopentenyl-diphosphate Delta-isomerase
MSPVGENMLIDAVDGADAPIGQITRRDVFRRHVNFRVVHVLIFNSNGELLLQRLALTRTRHPGYWGSSVAGYLFSNERYYDAARRRVAQELGILDVKLHRVGKIVVRDDECLKFVEVFTAIYDGPFQFDQGHIDTIQFLPISVVRSLQRSGERQFTPTFLKVLDFYQAQHRLS